MFFKLGFIVIFRVKPPYDTASLKSASVSAVFTMHDDDACTKKICQRECIFKYSGITVLRG